MNIPFFRSTKHQADYWRNRKIDWKAHYLDTWTHPHRQRIIQVLKTFFWGSLMEVGCGPGPNLIAILDDIRKHSEEWPSLREGLKGVQLGGFDVNEDAIALAKKAFTDGLFKVCPADDLMLSDKATDVTLTDMCLIYVGPFKIDKHILELKRISRNHVIFCEFHSRSLLRRLWIKLTTGYNVYNYFSLLSKHGFYDILSYKLTPEDWPGCEKQKGLRHIFLARVPKR